MSGPRHTGRVDTAPRPGAPLAGIAVTLAGVALIVAGILLIPDLRAAVGHALSGDTEAMREEIDDLGAGGPLIILALCVVHSVVWYPAEIVDAVAGYAYGFGPAMALVMFGWLLNALIAYWIGHTVARPVLHRFLGVERFERTEAMIERGGVTLLLALRLIPIVPFSLTGYACGAARVPLWRFIWTSMVGYLPITAISVYLGSQLEELSLTDPLVLGSIAVFLLLIGAAHRFIPRSDREEVRG